MKSTGIRRTTWIGVLAGIVCAGAIAAHAAEPDLRLVAAAARQDAAAVQALIAEGVDVDARRPDGVTALLWAAHRDDLETAGLLLAARADANAADDHGVTPLIRAAENASPKLVDRLLAVGADADAAQANGLTALMVAARTGNLEIVRALLTHGADVNAATTQVGATALMWAVAAPHRAIVEALLEGGADVHVSTIKGMTPLLTAAQRGNIEMARLLVAAGADVNQPGSDGTHTLPYAIVTGRDEFALFLLEQGADPNSRIDGIPALAAAAGNVDTWLVDWDRRHGDGRYVSRRRSRNGRIYMNAAQRLPLVHALLAAGADPNGRIKTSAMLMNYIGYPKKGAFEPFACGTGDLRGATPLWVAAFGAASDGAYRSSAASGRNFRVESSAEIVQVLLDAGADQSLTTADGTTPFMAAAGLGRSTFRPNWTRGRRSQGAESATRVLLEAGAEINVVNEADFTALHGAAFRGLNEVVRYLVEQGADIDARDYRGRTPFRLAEGVEAVVPVPGFPRNSRAAGRTGRQHGARRARHGAGACRPRGDRHRVSLTGACTPSSPW